METSQTESSQSTGNNVILHKQKCIDALLELTQAINSNQSMESIFHLLDKTLKEKFNYSNIFILYKRNKGWFIAENNKHSDLDNLDIVEYLTPFTEITYLEKEETSFGEYDTIIPIFRNNKALAYVMIDGVHNQIIDSLDEELTFLQTYSNTAILAAENKRLQKKEIDQQLRNRDLETAAEIQKALIPQSFPEYEECSFAAEYLPHREIGGDSFDVIPHPTHNAVYISVADVSGKGVPAALLMANFQAILRSAIQYEEDHTSFAKRLNKQVYDITKGDRFISLFVALVNFKSRRIDYINFGHNPPILQTEDKIQVLDEGSTILGVFEELPFLTLGKVPYDNQALLFAYTDGLTDLMDETETRFETERLKKFLNQEQVQDPSKLNADLLSFINQYRGKKDFTDDITFLTTLIDHKNVSQPSKNN